MLGDLRHVFDVAHDIVGVDYENRALLDAQFLDGVP